MNEIRDRKIIYHVEKIEEASNSVDGLIRIWNCIKENRVLNEKEKSYLSSVISEKMAKLLNIEDVNSVDLIMDNQIPVEHPNIDIDGQRLFSFYPETKTKTYT